MSKLAMPLRLIDIFNRSCHPLQTYGCDLNPLFKKYQ